MVSERQGRSDIESVGLSFLGRLERKRLDEEGDTRRIGRLVANAGENESSEGGHLERLERGER